MTIILEAPFATAEDTAEELGVSKSRLKRLIRLVDEQAVTHRRSSNHRIVRKKGATFVNSTRKRKHARGKAKKAAR